MGKFASLNLGGTVSPAPDTLGMGMTPAFYDVTGAVAITFGLGTRNQMPLPHGNLQDVVDVGWRWLGGRLRAQFRVTPTFSIPGFDDGGEVTLGDPFTFDADFPVGPDSDPDFYGKDLTAGGDYTVQESYDYWSKESSKFLLATYSVLEATNGIEHFYGAPIIDVSTGRYALWTNDVNEDGVIGGPGGQKVLYWNDDVEFTLRWRYLVSGPGLPDHDPPIPGVDNGTVTEAPATDSGQNVALPMIVTSIFDPNAPHFAPATLFRITDDKASRSYRDVEVRRFSTALVASEVESTAETHLNISIYRNRRAPL